MGGLKNLEMGWALVWVVCRKGGGQCPLHFTCHGYYKLLINESTKGRFNIN